MERVESFQYLLVRVAEAVASSAGDDGVRGGDCGQKRDAARRFGTVVPKL